MANTPRNDAVGVHVIHVWNGIKVHVAVRPVLCVARDKIKASFSIHARQHQRDMR